MKLSMWILKDWLSKYNPKAKITSGEMILRSARILSNNTDIEKENVYIARADEFISNEKDKVICVQGQDMLLLNTGSIEDVLNDVFGAFDFYDDWVDDAQNIIEEDRELSDLLERSIGLFGQPVILYDSGNQAIAFNDFSLSGSDVSVDEEWDSIISSGANSLRFLESMRVQLKLLRDTRDVRRMQAPGVQVHSVYRSLYINETFAGRMVLLEITKELSQGQLQLYDVFGKLIEEWMGHSDTYLISRSETAVFKELLEGKSVSKEEADRKLQMIGWEKEDKKELIRIEFNEDSREIIRPFFSRLERQLLNEYCILFEDYICIFVNLEVTNHNRLKEKLSPLLYSGNLCALVSYTFTDAFELSRCSELCRLTYEYTPKERGGIYMCADYALESIRQMVALHIPKALSHPALDILKGYDAQNGSELYHTLHTYLLNNCSTAKTAQVLSLHRNSLLYRINQIKEITGLEINDSDEREYLLFSFYLD